MPTNPGPFEARLTGGHPNSLGNTAEVVDTILKHPNRLEELYQCYFSSDEVVRLRTSNALKRICAEHSDWLVPYLDCFLTEVAAIDQASAQWTLAQLWNELKEYMTDEQQHQAQAHLQHNLENCQDWIVLNNTMQTLSDWASEDHELREWLRPRLQRISEDPREAVAGRAKKLLKTNK